MMARLCCCTVKKPEKSATISQRARAHQKKRSTTEVGPFISFSRISVAAANRFYRMDLLTPCAAMGLSRAPAALAGCRAVSHAIVAVAESVGAGNGQISRNVCIRTVGHVPGESCRIGDRRASVSVRQTPEDRARSAPARSRQSANQAGAFLLLLCAFHGQAGRPGR